MSLEAVYTIHERLMNTPPFEVFRHELDEFYSACALARSLKLTSSEYRDLTKATIDVARKHGIPDQILPVVTAESKVHRKAGQRPLRDMAGRWCSHPDMLENGVPLVINWDDTCRIDSELFKEYSDAFRLTLTNQFESEFGQ